MLIHKLMLPTLLSWSPRRVLLSNVVGASRRRRSSILKGRKVLFLHQSEEVRALLTGRGQGRAIGSYWGQLCCSGFRLQCGRSCHCTQPTAAILNCSAVCSASARGPKLQCWVLRWFLTRNSAVKCQVEASVSGSL